MTITEQIGNYPSVVLEYENRYFDVYYECGISYAHDQYNEMQVEEYATIKAVALRDHNEDIQDLLREDVLTTLHNRLNELIR